MSPCTGAMRHQARKSHITSKSQKLFRLAKLALAWKSQGQHTHTSHKRFAPAFITRKVDPGVPADDPVLLSMYSQPKETPCTKT
jgi:hypothetical protein